jgi:hypothetical protein
LSEWAAPDARHQVLKLVRESQGSFRGVMGFFEACEATSGKRQTSGSSRHLRWAGRWVLPCSPPGLRPSPVRGPRGRHRGIASERRTARLRHSMNRSILLRSVRTRAGPLATRAGRNRSPDRMTEALPLLGFVTFRPSTDTSIARPLPATRVAPRRLRADGTTRPASFRPRGFAPPRRFPPRAGLRACCIPLPVLRFVRVSLKPAPTVSRGGSPGGDPHRSQWVSGPRSSRRSYPSKSSPRFQPHRVTAARYLLAVGSAPERTLPSLSVAGRRG